MLSSDLPDKLISLPSYYFRLCLASFPAPYILWIPGDEDYISNAEAKSLLELLWDNDPRQ